MTNTTRTFLGDGGLWRDAQMEYDDVHGLWGGRHIIVQGDGGVLVRAVDRTQHEEIKRGDIGDLALDILELCVSRDILSLPRETPALVPDEVTMQIILTNSAGETRMVAAFGAHAVDPGFRAVADALLDVEKRMAAPKETSPPAPVEDPVSDRSLELMAEFFTAQKWTFVRHAERPLLKLEFTGKNGSWRCVAQSLSQRQQILFYSVCPLRAPEAKRQAVAEFITRANYGMATGNFELDFSDGEIRYKTSIESSDMSIVDFNLIQPMVYRNLTMLDRYLPGIMEVLYSTTSPAEAVQKVEST